MGWTAANLPASWEALRESWWQWHVVRTMLAMAGFAIALAAVLSRRHD